MSTMIKGREGATYFHLAQLKSAIRLEKLGMRLSQGRGRTAYAFAKKIYGYKGNRDKVISQIEADMKKMLEEKAATPATGEQNHAN